nr:hypothetical protein P5648_21970 [Bacillus subtilis]WGD75966.1 hypothetical protein P5631_22610 [Bacillus subtilis]
MKRTFQPNNRKRKESSWLQKPYEFKKRSSSFSTPSPQRQKSIISLGH